MRITHVIRVLPATLHSTLRHREQDAPGGTALKSGGADVNLKRGD